MLFPDSLPGLIRMTHRFARRVVHPLDCAPMGAAPPQGDRSLLSLAGCDEEPHPGLRQVDRCDEFGGAVNRPSYGRRIELERQPLADADAADLVDRSRAQRSGRRCVK
jgi:hypothetical protein